MKASVIIPLFNNESRIGRCLDSLLAQDESDFEIIIVDDGSTDKSLQVACKYESEKVKIYSKSNGGPASARNYGLRYCSPESRYVMFVDSDDTVVSNYVSSLLSLAEHDNLVICGINNYLEENYKPTYTDAASGLRKEHVDIWNDVDFLQLLRRGVINSSCNKCYSLDIIRRLNVVFPDAYPEDTFFNIEYLNHCNSVVVSEASLYNYIHRSGSVTGEPHESLYKGYIELQRKLYGKVSDNNRVYVCEFVYPQYLGNTRNYLRHGDFKTPMSYLKNKYIKEAIIAHRSTCVGDAVVKYVFRLGFLRILNLI